MTLLDCQRCGACCCNPDENRVEGFRYYVEVQPDNRLLRREELRKRYVVEDAAGVPHLRLDPVAAAPRCAASWARASSVPSIRIVLAAAGWWSPAAPAAFRPGGSGAWASEVAIDS
jgi:hypothetical protein